MSTRPAIKHADGCCSWPPLDGCRWCGVPEPAHRVRDSTAPGIGPHHWTPPTTAQRAARWLHQPRSARSA